MKTVFIGDIHGRDIWKDIIKNESPGRVVFIGDYFDSFDKSLTAAIQIHNFKEILALKESGNMEVIILIGNHDYHYYPGGEIYSGYQSGAAPAIRQLLEENKQHMQMCYELDNILCSHAGIGHEWLMYRNNYTEGGIADFVNDIWKYKPDRFLFDGLDSYGDSTSQTPIWIRPRSLMKGNHDSILKKAYIQVVGHTAVRKIDIQGNSTGNRYYLIDTFDTGKEYLIYENQEFRVGTLYKEDRVIA